MWQNKKEEKKIKLTMQGKGMIYYCRCVYLGVCCEGGENKNKVSETNKYLCSSRGVFAGISGTFHAFVSHHQYVKYVNHYQGQMRIPYMVF